FDDRIALQATYWNRLTEDVLVDRQFAPSGGFTNTQLDNIGEMKAWGLELGINGSVFTTPDFSLNLFANASYLTREVTDMGGAPDLKVGYFRYLTWVKEGYAPGAFFGAKITGDEYPIDIDRDNVADSRDALLAYFGEPRAADAFLPSVVAEDGDGDLIDHYLG